MDVKEFLNKSYTAYHAVKYGAEMLEKAGFKKLDMKDVWHLEKTSAITSSKRDEPVCVQGGRKSRFQRGGKPHRFPVAQSQRK